MTTAINTNSIALQTIHTCPKCGQTAATQGELVAEFGMRGNIPQSQCKACRSIKRVSAVPVLMQTIRYGVEIEFDGGASRQTVAGAVQSVVGGTISGYNNYTVTSADGRKWEVVYDGSVGGGEVVSPILQGSADLETVQAIARAMRRCGAYSNERCGIHVHVDGGAFDDVQVKNFVRIVGRFEPVLIAAANVHPSRQRWAEPMLDAVKSVGNISNKTINKNVIKGAWYGAHSHLDSSDEYSISRKYHRSRYRGINLHSFFYRGTIEYRYFNGTLHAGKIAAYVNLCLAFAAKAIDAKQVTSAPAEVATGLSIDECKAQAAKLFKYLELTGAEYKSTRFHLLNGILAKNGHTPLVWSSAAE